MRDHYWMGFRDARNGKRRIVIEVYEHEDEDGAGEALIRIFAKRGLDWWKLVDDDAGVIGDQILEDVEPRKGDTWITDDMGRDDIEDALNITEFARLTPPSAREIRRAFDDAWFAVNRQKKALIALSYRAEAAGMDEAGLLRRAAMELLITQGELDKDRDAKEETEE